MNTEENPIVALHGFLGLAEDWNHLDLEIESVDLWTDVGDDMPHWALRFNSEVRGSRTKPVLIGYSMGGRLAMQAVLQAPELYSGAIFISANPGLRSDKERAERLRQDQVWSERFRTEEWASLVSSWSEQSVLRTPPNAALKLNRLERDFDRERLAAALLNWSIGHQPDYRPLLETLQIPVLFISGSEDTKFTSLLNSLKLSNTQRHEVIEGAGHRVPWDRPVEFVRVVREFLAGVR